MTKNTKKRIQAPCLTEELMALRAGDFVQMTGTIYTARDAAHKRLLDDLAQGIEPPVDLTNQAIYYVGPAPAKVGHAIGPAGPTTSIRMDPYTGAMLDLGVKALIGKGYRGDEVKQALLKHGAVYLAAIGGAAALLSRQIQSSEIVAYDDLGPEAIRRLTVVDFPLIVVNDCHGGDAYESAKANLLNT